MKPLAMPRLGWVVFLALLILFACGIVAYVLQTFCDFNEPGNNLGLTRSDLAYGGHPDLEALLAKTKAVADVYLSQHESELKEVCGGVYELTSDYSLSPKLGSLGYRSSFYYFCWDIYLPYSLQSKSSSAYIVAVQLWDRTEGNTHDPDKFQVLRAFIIDQNGQTIKTLQ